MNGMVRSKATAFRRMTLATLVALMATPADASSVRDGSGRDVVIADASRIVSIGGAVTEILYALGLESRILAVDTTSLYPERALAEKPNVGYMRALSPEGVLGLAPSLIIAAEGAGPKETLAVLDAAKVPFFRVPDPYSGEGIVEKIKLIAAAVGAERQGHCLATGVQRDLDALAALRGKVQKPVRVMFVLSMANGRVMVSGGNTAAQGIIKLAGAENAVTGYDGYKPINDESIIAAKPDVILSMNRAGHGISADTLFALPSFSLTPAAEKRALIAMEGHYLLSFGPRTARAARDLALALYPQIEAAALPSDSAAADCK